MLNERGKKARLDYSTSTTYKSSKTMLKLINTSIKIIEKFPSLRNESLGSQEIDIDIIVNYLGNLIYLTLDPSESNPANFCPLLNYRNWAKLQIT